MSMARGRGGVAVCASALAVSVGLVLGGCGQGAPARTPTADTPAATVGPENIAVVDSGVLRSGPMISGSLEAEQQATVRAEIAGQVTQTFVEQGESVRSGQRMATIDATSLREAALSAQSAVRSAQSTLDNARRDLRRNQRLYQAGAIAERDVQAAQQAVTTAEAAVADAKARLTLAQQQLDKATVRTPFAGVVSVRSVNAGDVMQPGTEMFTIVNPSSMRLQASVPAAQLSALRVGEAVRFSVTGYPNRAFTGHISRISPTADPATRQVQIYVSIPNAGNALVAGLYAQGTVASETVEGLVAPATAIDRTGMTPTVVRIQQGKAQRVPVQLGLRDSQTNQVEVRSGLALGDTLLLGAAAGVTPGTAVHVIPASDQPVANQATVEK